VPARRRGSSPLTRQRPRGLIIVLWRAGLRISEALAHFEADLDPRRGAVLVRRGKAAGVVRSAITSVYLQGIDNAEVIEAVHARRAPMVRVHVGLAR
jgi:hypothetical protein